MSDSNSAFFHACVGKRNRDNAIHEISIGGEREENPDLVKEGISNHFESLLEQDRWSRPTLDGVVFKKISAEDNYMLTATFSREEIKTAVWGCEGNKSPGPDGYNFTVLKSLWSVLGEDFTEWWRIFIPLEG